MNTKNRVITPLLAALMTLASTNAMANDGEAIFKKQCVQCHEYKANSGPQSLKEVWEQKGPDLSSAGVKYKPDWVARWLTNPQRIRPAGMFYGNHIKPGKEQDVIDEKTLPKHPALSETDAKSVTQYLSSLKAKADLIKPGAFTPGKISLRGGEMVFVKFKGCAACHRIEPGYGGVSGPEVYTATNRLNEDYLMSFLADPQAWSPKTFMPTIQLAERDRNKLIRYFQALAKEEF